jgi:hypothetical protein
LVRMTLLLKVTTHLLLSKGQRLESHSQSGNKGNQESRKENKS